MLNLKKIAVTGGLACGKSSACRFFKELGCYVVNADSIVHDLLHPNNEVGKKVIQLLGSEIVVQGRIDRSKIAKRVFNSSQLLKSLEEILHPAVHSEIEKHYQKAITSNASLFVAEIPLLFESGAETCYDYTLVIFADEESCRRRFMENTGYSKEEFDSRNTRQINLNEKIKRADFVIENTGSLDELKQNIVKIYHQLLSLGVRSS